MKQTCYYCLHADFKTAYQDEHQGFAYCRKNQFVKATWSPPQWECDKGRFEMATDETMAARKRFFASMGDDVSGL